MGVFEYIGVLISVIMGLGVTHLAIGATKLIQHREEVRFYVPHMQMLLAVVGIVSRNKIVHVILPILFFASLVILVLFSTAAQINESALLD